MQTSGPKNMKRIRGRRPWASRHENAKPEVIRKGSPVNATGVWKESRCAIPGEICLLVRKDQLRCEAGR